MTLNSTGLGIGASPTNVLTVRAAQDTGIELNSAASNASRLITAYDPANTRWYINSTFSGSGTTLPLTFLVGNTERVRIDTSGNVGIGGSPSDLLTVSGANKSIRITNKTAYNGSVSAYLGFDGYYNSSNETAWFARVVSGKENATNNNVNGYIAFQTNGTADGLAERVRIDSSGNVGIGVTPSAWGGGYKALQLGSSGTSFWGGVNFSEYNQNAYFDGTNMRYINAFAASKYYQANGAHSWHTAQAWSGSGSSVLTYTQLMTLDASGNLVLGGSSAGASLHVIRNSGSGVLTSAPSIIASNIASSASPYAFSFVGAWSLNETLKAELFADGSGTVTGGVGGALFTRTNHPLYIGTNNTTRLTISSAGAATFTGDVTINGTGYVKNGTANTSQIARTYNATLSATSNTEFTVNHNLGTRSVMVQVRQVASPYATVITDVERTDSDNVKIKFASSVTGSDYNVVVLG